MLANSHRATCPYCGSALAVERSNGEATFQLAETIQQSQSQTQAAIAAGATATQAELRRLQLNHELSNLQLRLSNVQSEMRELERTPKHTAVTRRQLAELQDGAVHLQSQIQAIMDELHPSRFVAAPDAGTRARRATPIIATLLWAMFSLRGRLSRGGFWGALFLIFVMSSLALAGDGANPLAGLLLLVGTWAYVAAGVKRYHDLNKSGWWIFIALIPVIGQIWQWFELGFAPGTPGPNRYG